MGNFIKKINISILNEKFNQSVQMLNGLNIISGVNGSGKTLFLSYIQQSKNDPNKIEINENLPLLIASFSPKRNAQRILIEQAQQLVRQDINAEQNTLNAFLNQQLQDDGVQTIKSISEYLILSTDKIVDNGDKTKEQATTIIKNDYSKILEMIFEYNLEFSWNPTTRKYESKIKKDSEYLEFNKLSSGENALISLIFAIFYSKDSADVYLIDEPEVHLNWQLEEKLFIFLNWFSNEYSKQMIIVTHSRVCFTSPFNEMSKFFLWDSGKIIIKDRPDERLVSLLSGDVVKIVNGITANDKMLYLEDQTQENVIKKIADKIHINLEIIKLGNCDNVKKQAEAFKKLNIDNVYFLIDNDNKSIVPGGSYHANLIQLKKYCIENYLLNEDILSAIDKNNPKKIIKEQIFHSIREVDSQNFVPIKTLLNNYDILNDEILDRIDASKFIKNLYTKLGYTDINNFIDEYINKVSEMNKMDLFTDFYDQLFR